MADIRAKMLALQTEYSSITSLRQFAFLPTPNMVVTHTLARTANKRVKLDFDQRVASMANKRRLEAKWYSTHPDWVAELKLLDDHEVLFQYVSRLFILINKIMPFTQDFPQDHQLVVNAVVHMYIKEIPDMKKVMDNLAQEVKKYMDFLEEYLDTLLHLNNLRAEEAEPKSAKYESGFTSGALGRIRDTSSQKWKQLKKTSGKKWGGFKEGTGETWTSLKKSSDKKWKGFKKGSAKRWTGLKSSSVSLFDRIRGKPPVPSSEEESAPLPPNDQSAAQAEGQPTHVPEKPEDYDQRPVTLDYTALFLSCLTEMGQNVVKWHDNMLSKVVDYPTDIVFDFLPTYEELFRTAFDYEFTPNKYIVHKGERDDLAKQWKQSHPNWYEQVKRLEVQQTINAYVRYLITLMSDLKRDICFVHQETYGHWRVARMTARPDLYGQVKREPLLALGILIDDFNTIGYIASQWRVK